MSALPNLHPMFVHFPVALYATAVACDVGLVLRFRLAWLDRSAVLLYVVAALTSLSAALTGKLAADALAHSLSERTESAVAEHGDWAFFSVAFLFGVSALRFDALWRDRTETAPRLRRVRVVALAISLVGLVVLTHTAFRGGELVYQYGVGVTAALP